jgi:hypothetical protein
MSVDHEISPEREKAPQPGLEEHPGEDGALVDPARTRLKRRDPEGEGLGDGHVPHESDSGEHEKDA